MVVIIVKLQREGHVVGQQRKVFRIFNSIISWAHWIHNILEIVLNLVEIQSTNTNT